MDGTRCVVLACALTCIGYASTKNVRFSLREPVIIAGTPTVTLGPGTYVVRTLDRTSGMNVIQVLSKRQDYLYTTVLTIPATRPHADDKRPFVFSEAPSGSPPALRFWFPPGESTGHEFINSPSVVPPQPNVAPRTFQLRTETKAHSADVPQSAANLYALPEHLRLIENGKFAAARDCSRRNYYLVQSREGAITSLLLAMLMTDFDEANEALGLVKWFDPTRTGVLAA